MDDQAFVSPIESPQPPPLADIIQDTLPPPKSKLPLFIGLLLFIIILLAGTAGISLTRQKPKTPTVTSTLSPTPTTDPLANWKIFTSSDLSIELKYPPSWEQSGPDKEFPDTPYVLKLLNKESNYTEAEIRIGTYVNQIKAKTTFEKIKDLKEDQTAREKYPSEYDADTVYTKIRDSQINNLKAVFYTSSVVFKNSMSGNVIPPPTIIDINNKGTIYTLQLTMYNAGNDYKAFQNTLDQILSTFKFLNTNDKTYTDANCHFQFQYPSDWKAIPSCVDSVRPNIPCLQSPDFKGELGVPADNVEQGKVITFQCSPDANTTTDKLLAQCKKDKATSPNLLCQQMTLGTVPFMKREVDHYVGVYNNTFFTILTLSKTRSEDSMFTKILSTFKITP